MPIKEKKSSTELEALLMKELRKNPECNHVISVAIIRPLEKSWDAQWTVEGNEVVCPRAFKIARALQAKFDLA